MSQGGIGSGGTAGGPSGVGGVGGGPSACRPACSALEYCDQATCRARLTEFTIPTAGSHPGQIVAGTDGKVWFTDNGKIGRITSGGSIAEFDPLSVKAYAGETADVEAVALGPDNNVWFTMTASSGIGYLGVITPDGDVENYAFSDATAPASDSIASGPDGNLWFVQTKAGPEQRGNLIYTSTTNGSLRSIPLPHQAAPLMISTGPDGYMWVALQDGGVQINDTSITQVDRVSTQGNVTEVALPPSLKISDLVAGKDSYLWTTTNQGIGRVSVDGKVVIFPLVNASDPGAGRIVAGPDNTFWFTAYYGATFGVIDSSGNIATFTAPSRVEDITTGGDGVIWFTEPDVAKIGRFVSP